MKLKIAQNLNFKKVNTIVTQNTCAKAFLVHS